MDDKTAERLSTLKAEKSYYDALQLYRTKATRGFRSKNMEQVLPLIYDGFAFFLQDGQQTSMSDVANLYTDSLMKNSITGSDAIYALIAKMASQMMSSSEYEKSRQNRESASLNIRRKFVDDALKWTKSFADSVQEKRHGSRRLHYFLANNYLQSNQLESARNHFLYTDETKSFAKFLNQLQLNCGAPSERDLFIVQPVLQLLCLDRFPVAKQLFEDYVQESKAGRYPFDVPLFNFVHLLFNVLASVKKDQFTALVEVYLNELKRDPSFAFYIEKIGKIYLGFGKSSQGSFSLKDIFQGMAGGSGDGEEVATSHLSGEQLQAAPPQKPLAHVQPASASAPPKQISDNDDLD